MKIICYQYKFFIITILLGLVCCKQSDTNKHSNNIDRNKISLDTLIYNNYVKAVDNESTFQYFLVAKIKNVNTGQVREICTKGVFFKGALHNEYKIAYDSLGQTKVKNLLIKNKNRYFEFKDTIALKNLGLGYYNINDLINFEKQNNIDLLAQTIENNKWSKAISNDKIMLLYAHSLFNRGVLTGENNCFGGSLVHIDEKNLRKMEMQKNEIQQQMNLVKQNNK
jgi:hypothetical protein